MELLDNPIQNYAWGSKTALADFLGHAPSGQPEAELWIGAHPKAPSRLARGGSLLEALAEAPSERLGAAVRARFEGRLPFLLKVLAVDAPLSLQAHPDLPQARAGFAREEAAGVALDAPHRTYKDDNHKPELLCALTPFEALSGFREPAEAAALLASLGPGGRRIAEQLDSERQPLKRVFSELMTLAAEPRAALVAGVVGACEQAQARPSPHQAALQWVTRLARSYPGDVGAVGSLLLNHLRLEPLQAVYLEAGRLHAYLSGMGVEIMANSDNVLRGGLTPKHVDVPELLRVLRFDSPPVRPMDGREGPPGQFTYPTPAAEFELCRLEVDGEMALRCSGPELLLCAEGMASVIASGRAPVDLCRGQSGFLSAGSEATVRGSCRLFRARVPAP